MKTTRRQWLASAVRAGAAAGLIVRSGPAEARPTPNERLNIGIIGAGGRGAANAKKVAGENIVALCDVNAQHLAKAATQYPKARTYTDWRKLVNQKDLDAVVVSTTDHTHAFASVWAMNRGLSVYCEKPLAHSVYQARLMQQKYLANKDRLATQMGTQIHATENYRRVVELIRSGAIGPVREVYVWCGRKGLVDGNRPRGEYPVPEHLDWDLWLGPAPLRPYHPCYLPGCMAWEQWWDFGNGCLGDMGSHLIDLPFWALELHDPQTITAVGAPLRAETYPEWLTVCWEHPARGPRPPLKLHWYDGVKRPESPPGHDLKRWGIGVLFIGDAGMLLADYGRRILLPEAKFKNFEPPAPSIPKSPGHYQEWLDAAKTGTATPCNFAYSGKLIEHNLLGIVAFRAQCQLEWNPVGLNAVNCPPAMALIRGAARAGWILDG